MREKEREIWWTVAGSIELMRELRRSKLKRED